MLKTAVCDPGGIDDGDIIAAFKQGRITLYEARQQIDSLRHHPKHGDLKEMERMLYRL